MKQPNKEGDTSYHSRRSVLGSVAAASGTAAITSIGTVAADGPNKFIGKTYDPVTDKEQGNATAVLDFAPDGLKGTLSAAGFDIDLGVDEPLSDHGNNSNSSMYTFMKNTDEYSVNYNGKNLPLHGRLDVIGSQITGTLKRPSAEYGPLAFSLSPISDGITAEDIGRALKPDRRREIVTGFSEVSLPKKGIPTSNSVRNMYTSRKVEDNRNIGDNTGLSSEIEPSDDDEYDVGAIVRNLSPESSDYHFYPSRCDKDSRTINWECQYATFGTRRYDSDGELMTSEHEIAFSNDKRWHMQLYFEDPPDPHVEPCDQDEGIPFQTNIEFWAGHSDESDLNDVEFRHPRPKDSDDDNGTNSEFLGTVLNIVGVVGGKWGQIGSTIVGYALLNGSGSSGPSVSDTGTGEKQEFYWDLPLDDYAADNTGNKYFPAHPDDAAGANITVDNKAGHGHYIDVRTRARFEWLHLEYYDAKCPCEHSGTFAKRTTTDLIDRTGSYKSVEV
ncbi:hypothetical protein [Natrialba sp. PRR66]|uniref:hypothetical protein n=1 Tax=Natrialba sp. PRR66 TaxID=3098146 RepID=UPI002B1DE0E8|nr:hypothetical protein [Natrialba sp. PRR66]